MSTNNVLIGKRIRAARERLGMNQSELARKSGATASYLNRLEIGAFGTPSVEKLTNIATALGMRQCKLGHWPRKSVPARPTTCVNS